MTSPIPAAANPYPGLRPFEEQEEHLFFGREAQLDRMIDTLAARRLLAVVGGSGSGKSSLVICGLQPGLHRGLMASAGTAWTVVRFRPGLRPLTSLAAALSAAIPAAPGADLPELPLVDVLATQLRLSRLGLIEVYGQLPRAGQENLLLVVDQFEELFRYESLREGVWQVNDPEAREEARGLVNLLLAAIAQRACPIYVVLTMRSDFLGDCSQFPGITEAISAALHLVPRLSREERRQAIANPALVSGTQVDPALLTRLVNDGGDDPDQLSILQHALRRTWNHWQQRGGQGPITLADYEAIGTMATALDSHAEQTLAEVQEADGLRLCARLFRALTDRASDPRGIRRPTTLAALREICGGEPATVDRLIDHFRRSDRAFLMPPTREPLQPDSVIDISHESLMRVWRRLDHWAQEEATAAALLVRLDDAARRQRLGQSSLWRDPELQLALNWQREEQPNPAWATRYIPSLEEALAFLDRSRETRDAELRRRRRRRRQLMAALVGLSVLASLIATFSWRKWQQTRLSRARAYSAMAAALLPERPRESLLYGLAALERLLQDPAEALSTADALAQAVNLNWEIAELPGGASPISTVLPLHGGEWIAAAADGSLQLWRQNRPIGAPIASEQDQVLCLLELADGVVVSGGGDGSLRLWRDGVPLGPPIAGGGGAVLSLAQLDNGELISGDELGNLRRWRDGRPIGVPIATGQGRLTALLALPGGDLLSGGSAGQSETGSRRLRRWRAGRPLGAPIRSGHDGVLQLLAGDGQVYSLGSEGQIETWRSGQLATTPWPKQAVPVRRLALRGNGELVSSHDDGSLRRWRGKRLMGLGYAATADLGPLVALKGGRLLAADGVGALHLLDATPLRDAMPVDSGQQGVWSLLVQPDGEVISGGEDGSLRRWRQGRPLGPARPTGQGSIRALLGLADGELISGGSLSAASGEEQSSLRRWRGLIPNGAAVGVGVGAIRQLLEDGAGEMLSIADGGVEGSLLRRWRLGAAAVAGAPASLGAAVPLPPPRINSMVRLPGGDLLGANRITGGLQRWQRTANGLKPGELIATGLDGVGGLALMEGGRRLLLGSIPGREGGQDVQILDLQSREWMGRPLRLRDGWASALAVLPDQGVVIGSTAGELRWIQPRRILSAACAELGRSPRKAARSSALSTNAVVLRLARRACFS
ncbi:MAG: WD40 repeat domain-containing protein [Cyanobium sp.]